MLAPAAHAKKSLAETASATLKPSTAEPKAAERPRRRTRDARPRSKYTAAAVRSSGGLSHLRVLLRQDPYYVVTPGAISVIGEHLERDFNATENLSPVFRNRLQVCFRMLDDAVPDQLRRCWQSIPEPIR
jgi:hypothetical protein